LLRLQASAIVRRVIEMGMNHPGEIAYLAGIARPSVAVVTNAQRAHLEGMGSLEAIAAEKGSIYSGLDESGIAVFCADDQWAELWRSQSRALRMMTFGFEKAADVRGRFYLHGLESRLSVAAAGDEVEIVLALPGQHNARNALAAATACLAAGVSAGRCAGRPERFSGSQGAAATACWPCTVRSSSTIPTTPIPTRSAPAIDVLAATIGHSVLVLGDMGEIGAMSGQFHDEIGGYAKSQGIDRLFTLGEASALAAHNFGSGGEHYQNLDKLIAALIAELNPETTVLVKGSRFMRMERVADAIALPAIDGGRLMLLLLAQWLAQDVRAFNVFGYITLRAVLAAMTALIISFLAGPSLIRWLAAKKIGQAVRQDGPQTHLVKSGTPTMGGALIVVAICFTTLALE
jgi:UDP-N-acetylmuramoyl-tripeptide--D-alanyl-D-alanine ligase